MHEDAYKRIKNGVQFNVGKLEQNFFMFPYHL